MFIFSSTFFLRSSWYYMRSMLLELTRFDSSADASNEAFIFLRMTTELEFRIRFLFGLENTPKLLHDLRVLDCLLAACISCITGTYGSSTLNSLHC